MVILLGLEMVREKGMEEGGGGRADPGDGDG